MPEPTLDDLRAVLRDKASDVLVPEPPLAEVAAGVRADRRRRARRGVAVVAALAAAVAAVVVLAERSADPRTQPSPADTPSSTPTAKTVDDLPRGPVTDVAYAVGRVLYVGNREVRLPGDVYGLSQVDSTVTFTDDAGRLFLVRTERDSLAPELIATGVDGRAMISPAANYVAYQRPARDDSVTLVVHPLDGGRDLVQRTPARPSCCDNPFVIDGITGDGVVGSMPALHDVWLWRIEFSDVTGTLTSAGLQKVSGLDPFPDATVDQVTPDHVVLNGSINLVVGKIREDGRFVESDCCAAVRGLRAESYDLRDPTGTRVAFVRDNALDFRELDSMTDTELRLPKAEAAPVIRWEDENHVLLVLEIYPPTIDDSVEYKPRSVLVRCSAKPRCERVADLLGAMSLAW